MKSKIISIGDEIFNKMSKIRRDLHKHPESAWTEFRTSAIIASQLKEHGLEVYIGEEIISKDERLSVPSNKELEFCMKRALAEGADPKVIDRMEGGLTGVVGILKNGQGPTIGIRVDIDALEVNEAQNDGHRPYKEGFSSIHSGLSHACGHDGHIAIGLAVAEIISRLKESINGTVKIIFQPGEEGLLGARPMVQKGILDDVDYLLGIHIGLKANRTGELIGGTYDFLASTKMDVTFKGQSTHAGLTPHKGNNALIASATAATNLYAISRHGDGASRVNVGTLHAGTGRNVIPDIASMEIETRGVSTEINDYMEERVIKVLNGAALMYDVEVDINVVGSTKIGKSDIEMINKVKEASKDIKEISEVIDQESFGASEDITYMLERVQSNGGKATFMMIGADLASDHHTPEFDFDEKVLDIGSKLIALTIYDILKTVLIPINTTTLIRQLISQPRGWLFVYRV